MNIIAKLLLLLTKLFYLHIRSRTIFCLPLSIFCTLILLSQLPASFYTVNPTSPRYDRGEQRELARFMSHAKPEAYDSASNQDGMDHCSTRLSGTQRSSRDNFTLLTETARHDAAKHPLPSTPGYRAPEHPVLVIKPQEQWVCDCITS